ncbi:MAG: type II toxin-antitoxin system MqsA family antitoxin [Dehalococcoidia bacterium]
MRCMLCRGGRTRPGTATIVLFRGPTTVIMKEVPAEVCGDCAEPVLAEEISERVLTAAEGAVERGAEIEILRFVA